MSVNLFHDDLFALLTAMFPSCLCDERGLPRIETLTPDTFDYHQAQLQRSLILIFEDAWACILEWRRQRPELLGLRILSEKKRPVLPSPALFAGLALPTQKGETLGMLCFETVRAGIQKAFHNARQTERYSGINEQVSRVKGDCYLVDYIKFEISSRVHLLSELVMMILSIAEEAPEHGSPFEIARTSLPLVRLLGTLGENAETPILMETCEGGRLAEPARYDGAIELLVGSPEIPWGFRNRSSFELFENNGSFAVRITRSVLENVVEKTSARVAQFSTNGCSIPMNFGWPMGESKTPNGSLLEELYLLMIELAEKKPSRRPRSKSAI